MPPDDDPNRNPAPPGEDDHPTLRLARRIVVVVIATTLALVGTALLVLPGPGTVLLLAALGLLATEFVWARAWLKRIRTALGLREPDKRSDAPE